MYDSHAHLNDEQFNDDIEQVLERAAASGVTRIVNVGFDLTSSRRAVDLAEKYPQLYAAVGVHPHEAKECNSAVLCQLRELATANPRVVAIGETGLDYYYDYSPRADQQKVFGDHLLLGRELNLPVIIHSRDAAADTLAILQESGQGLRCVLHCYSGSWEMAEQYLQMGYYISFAGPITFKNAEKLRSVAARIPLDRLLIETDCPYLAPVPYRGKRNEPSYVVQVAEKLAEIHGKSVAEVAVITQENTERFFGWKIPEIRD